jgi:hypothetical protein
VKRIWILSIGRVNIEFFPGWKKNQTAMYFLRSRLFTYDIMKNFNCNISLWFAVWFFFHPGKNSMLTRPMLSIQILFTNYDIITYFLNLAFCSEHFISIKHWILATFNINKKFNSDSLYAFKLCEIDSPISRVRETMSKTVWMKVGGKPYSIFRISNI